MALLPLAFFHYSRKPNLKFLLNSTFVLIVSFVLYVLLATPMQLGGFESERIAGTTFYYGNIAIRGGITYFSFVILLSPLLINYIKSWQKIILIMAIPIVLVFFLTALKRFVFLVVFLGILNYLFRPTMQTKYRLRIGFLTLIISLGVLSADFVQNATSERYLERGADRKFSTEAIESDMRIYEPYSVFMSILNKPIYNILIGEKGRPEYDIEHSGTVARRVIHNTYASLLSEIGIIGLILYLLIYYKFYTKIYFFYRSIKSYKKEYLLYWIAFQNMFLIFIIQGMVGGQIHVTLRGLVFLYSGALGGYFYSEYNKYKQQID
jgi:O-antigen ligase